MEDVDVDIHVICERLKPNILDYKIFYFFLYCKGCTCIEVYKKNYKSVFFIKFLY